MSLFQYSTKGSFISVAFFISKDLHKEELNFGIVLSVSGI